MLLRRGVFRVFCSFFASHPSCGRTIIFHHHCACGAGCRASADFGLLFLASTYACDTCRTLLSPGPVDKWLHSLPCCRQPHFARALVCLCSVQQYTHTNESMTVRDRFTTYDLCAVNSTQMPPEKIPCRHVGKKVLVAFYVMFTKRIISRNHLWWERVTYLSASFLSGTHAVARAW